MRGTWQSVMVAGVMLAGCGGSDETPRTAADHKPPAAAAVDAPTSGGLVVSTKIRRSLPRSIACEEGDACGFFLQVASPGSDADALANRAKSMLDGKCAGKVIVYRDARGVMGSGIVVATAEEKRACEKALGREREDTDFPNELVFRVAQ